MRTAATLLVYIYTNNEQIVSKVSDICTSDHCPVVCTWSCKTARKLAKGHSTIQYHSFKHFNLDDFLQYLKSAPFAAVFSVSTQLKRYQPGINTYHFGRRELNPPTLP